MRRAIAAMARAIYPARCMVCDTYTSAPGGLCPSCWQDTHFISGSTCTTCAAPLVGAVTGARCDSCLTFPPPWQQGVAVLEYEGAGRRMLLALKHHDRLDLAPTLGTWLHRAAAPLLPHTDLITPVPLHPGRLAHRKFNQSAMLARPLAKLAGIAYIPDLLTRLRNTESQQGKDRIERQKNLKAAIAPTPRHRAALAGKRVLLVDDVLTTGATLSACTEACFAAGARNVNICVLARVEPRRETSIFAVVNVKD
jgi:ComF family protein